MRLVVAGDPGRQTFAVGQVADFRNIHLEHLGAKTARLCNVGAVEKEVVQPDHAHTVRLLVPDVRVPQAGVLRRKFDARIELEGVAGGDLKADAAAETGLVGVGGDFLDGIAKGFVSLAILSSVSSESTLKETKSSPASSASLRVTE
jgi:hypothetical protein